MKREEVSTMTAQAIPETKAYEQTLIKIIRTLPIERVLQILDFARYIQLQTPESFALPDEEDEALIAADEARWDHQFAATQDGLKKMADQVRAEIRAGHSTPMVFTKEGRIVPG
jgi:hypothetical protein